MVKRMPQEIPGDTVGSARAVTEFWYNVGIAINDLDKVWEAPHHDQPQLTALTVRCDPADDQGVLVIAKGISEDGWVVAFHRDETIREALVGMSKRLKNHTAKWKEDKYANGD